MDMAKHSYWESYGGKPGLNYLLIEFRQMLEARGIDHYFEKMFFTNPQKLYTFTNL
jgi:phosphotriesterase-related protein